MSDEELRRLERRFRETGALEDEAAWLRARLRAGELDQARLELAAHCGLEAAVLVTGERSHALGEWHEGAAEEPMAWVEDLVQRWGEAALVRITYLALCGYVGLEPRHDAVAREHLAPVSLALLARGQEARWLVESIVSLMELLRPAPSPARFSIEQGRLPEPLPTLPAGDSEVTPEAIAAIFGAGFRTVRGECWAVLRALAAVHPIHVLLVLAARELLAPP